MSSRGGRAAAKSVPKDVDVAPARSEPGVAAAGRKRGRAKAGEADPVMLQPGIMKRPMRESAAAGASSAPAAETVSASAPLAVAAQNSAPTAAAPAADATKRAMAFDTAAASLPPAAVVPSLAPSALLASAGGGSGTRAVSSSSFARGGHAHGLAPPVSDAAPISSHCFCRCSLFPPARRARAALKAIGPKGGARRAHPGAVRAALCLWF